MGDRVHFHHMDAADAADAVDAGHRYDAVFAFECVHDLPDPVGALTSMRALAGGTAPVLVMDERVAETFTRPATRSSG